MILYNTVEKYGEAQQDIEKSRFIAYVKPVKTREEADIFIDEIRKKHRDATHNVPAVVIGDNFQVQWASDDGEPQGTSGAPIVQMLVQEKITNVAVVVTRYFGGIKLGTGGLVRAYTSSAKLGLTAGNVIQVKEIRVIKVKTDYSVFNKIQNLQLNFTFKISDIMFTEKVMFDILIDDEYREKMLDFLNQVSNGTAIVTAEETRLSTAEK